MKVLCDMFLVWFAVRASPRFCACESEILRVRVRDFARASSRFLAMNDVVLPLPQSALYQPERVSRTCEPEEDMTYAYLSH